MACSYKGHPRSQYSYSGNFNQLFTQWQNCQLTTQQFQTATPPGQGTASLTHTGPTTTPKQTPKQTPTQSQKGSSNGLLYAAGIGAGALGVLGFVALAEHQRKKS